MWLGLDVLRPEEESRYVDVEGLKERRQASLRPALCGVSGVKVVRVFDTMKSNNVSVDPFKSPLVRSG